MIRQLKDITTPKAILSHQNSPDYDTSIIYHLYISDSTVLDGLNPFLKDIFDSYNHLAPLSQEYLFNRMDKMLSPLYEQLLEWFLGVGMPLGMAVSYANQYLKPIIFNKFLDKWNRVANAFLSDYNPINNYDMTENEDTSLNTKSNTETKTTQKFAGYNSGTTLPVATETEGEGETTGTDEFNNSTRELTRSGNIGVTTSQQMIESELKLRKQNLLDIIYNDLDSILFLDYYN